jgi:hypothetical protein
MRQLMTLSAPSANSLMAAREELWLNLGDDGVKKAA